jgi:hypothetical protein
MGDRGVQRTRVEYSGLWSSAVLQFTTFVISLIISLSVANALDNRSAQHVKIFLPPGTTASPDGVSGGGPVGVGPIAIPSPTPGNTLP